MTNKKALGTNTVVLAPRAIYKTINSKNCFKI